MRLLVLIIADHESIWFRKNFGTEQYKILVFVREGVTKLKICQICKLSRIGKDQQKMISTAKTGLQPLPEKQLEIQEQKYFWVYLWFCSRKPMLFKL